MVFTLESGFLGWFLCLLFMRRPSGRTRSQKECEETVHAAFAALLAAKVPKDTPNLLHSETIQVHETHQKKESNQTPSETSQKLSSSIKLHKSKPPNKALFRYSYIDILITYIYIYIYVGIYIYIYIHL